VVGGQWPVLTTETLRGRWWKLPLGLVMARAGKGSFDCAFAQDDSVGDWG